MPLYMNATSQYLIDGNFNVNGSGTTPTESPTGQGNVALGQLALNGLQAKLGSNNIAIGVEALRYANEIGDPGFNGGFNIGIGTNASLNIKDATGNVAIGTDALKNYQFNQFSNESEDGSVAIGVRALENAGTDQSGPFDEGSRNVAIGFEAGTVIDEGRSNVFLGSGANASATDINGATALGTSATVTKNSQIMLGHANNAVSLPGLLEIGDDGLDNNDGSAAISGTAQLVAGTKTIFNENVNANSRILLSVQTAGGTQGFLSVGVRTLDFSFVINSTSATDTSIVSYLIIEPFEA